MPVEGPPLLTPPPPVVGKGISLPQRRSVEIAVPFQFDRSGAVATVTDPDKQVAQHVDALMRTIPGERVMKPTYGVSLLPYVFDNVSPAELAAMQQVINEGFNDWVPSARLTKLDGTTGPTVGVASDTVLINIEYIRTADPAQSKQTANIPVVRI